MTADQYDEMKIKQGGKCLICQKEKKLVVDHDHFTGKVRGLLCAQCNHGIGLLGENAVNLQRASDYMTLKRWEGITNLFREELAQLPETELVDGR
jgi:hypothetical protein